MGLAREVWGDTSRARPVRAIRGPQPLDRRRSATAAGPPTSPPLTARGLLGVFPRWTSSTSARIARSSRTSSCSPRRWPSTRATEHREFRRRPPAPVGLRRRPDLLNSRKGYLSFYAGHVATAFSAMAAGAYTVSHRHGARVWPWLATLVVGGSVAVERVVSGHHFPTDVTAAAIAGTTIGVAIPWLHLAKGSSPVTIGPSPLGPGLALGGRF